MIAGSCSPTGPGLPASAWVSRSCATSPASRSVTSAASSLTPLAGIGSSPGAGGGSAPSAYRSAAPNRASLLATYPYTVPFATPGGSATSWTWVRW